MKNDALIFLWHNLSSLIRELTEELVITIDEPGDFRVETKTGRPFVSVRIQKGYVGLYLLPLYYHPDVLPYSLKKFNSGKSTLRFKDEEQLQPDKLRTLIENCIAMIEHY
jgi:hypothetical protein